MATSEAPTTAQQSTEGRDVCAQCGHDNSTARIVTTLFRRRKVAQCHYQEEAVSGMAGSEVCVCRGSAHQALLAT